ncbi:MAG: hypothetical protein WDM81_13655 [Rhizomicrobium sp.]
MLGGIAAAIVAGVAWHAVARVQQAFADQAKIPGLQQTIRDKDAAIALRDKQTAITGASSMTGAIHQGQIRTVTQTIVKEVPIYVPASVDRDLPNGFVRLWDDAATGDRQPLPGPAGQPDDAASGVKLSQAGTVLAENYGTCRGIAQQLIDLQDWIVKERALTNGTNAGAPTQGAN